MSDVKWHKGDCPEPESNRMWKDLRDSECRIGNWCCKVIKEAGLEALQHHDCLPEKFHNILMNYCPHGGTQAKLIDP